MKLYRVFLRGLQDSAGGTHYGSPYVVANSTDEALKKVQDYLYDRNIGFLKEREMDRIELLAEASDRPNCQQQLFYVPPNIDKW